MTRSVSRRKESKSSRLRSRQKRFWSVANSTRSVYSFVRSGENPASTAGPSRIQMPNESIPKGTRFARLVVKRRVRIDYHERYECVCDCGTMRTFFGSHLRRGATRSCGCLMREKASNQSLRHGFARRGRRSREYGVWVQIIGRCYNEKNAAYANYGGRGIRVCDRWRTSFENFLADMGKCPAGLSLDREHNDGDYEPRNCRWATDTQQVRNRRTTLIVTLGGVSKPLQQWCEERGLRYQSVWARIDNGWSAERAINTPKLHGGGRRKIQSCVEGSGHSAVLAAAAQQSPSSDR